MLGVWKRVKIPTRGTNTSIFVAGTAARGQGIDKKYAAFASIKDSCSEIHTVGSMDT